MLRCVTTPFVITEEVSREFRIQSLTELARDSDDEIIAPG
jgi:hypothetical protein